MLTKPVQLKILTLLREIFLGLIFILIFCVNFNAQTPESQITNLLQASDFSEIGELGVKQKSDDFTCFIYFVKLVKLSTIPRVLKSPSVMIYAIFEFIPSNYYSFNSIVNHLIEKIDPYSTELPIRFIPHPIGAIRGFASIQMQKITY